jgi:hypothetical protein
MTTMMKFLIGLAICTALFWLSLLRVTEEKCYPECIPETTPNSLVELSESTRNKPGAYCDRLAFVDGGSYLKRGYPAAVYHELKPPHCPTVSEYSASGIALNGVVVALISASVIAGFSKLAKMVKINSSDS